MSDITIRRAHPEDVDAIASIHTAGYEETFRGLVPDEVIAARPIEMRRRVWKERLDEYPPQQFVVVAEVDGEVVGFASGCAATIEDADEPGVGRWESAFVRKDHQGSRVGKALQEETGRRLRALGFSEAVAFVFDINDRSKTFLERGGWVPDGEQREVEGALLLRTRRSLSDTDPGDAQ